MRLRENQSTRGKTWVHAAACSAAGLRFLLPQLPTSLGGLRAQLAACCSEEGGLPCTEPWSNLLEGGGGLGGLLQRARVVVMAG